MQRIADFLYNLSFIAKINSYTYFNPFKTSFISSVERFNFSGSLSHFLHQKHKSNKLHLSKRLKRKHRRK